MNKIIAAVVVVLVVLVAGWYLFTTPSVTDYTNTVDTEISELETELAALDAQVTAGTLSESDATAAKVQIVTRLNAINTAASASERATLTPAQRIQLVEGLERLKVILVTYRDTLTSIEVSADETAVTAELNRRGGSYNRSKSLNLVVADAIADVEETVQDSVQDYEANAELDAQIDDVVAEAEADVAMEEEGMSDEEPVDETKVEAEDNMSEEPMDDTDMGEEPMLDAEVSAEAELGTTTN